MSEPQGYDKALPIISTLSEPFWEAAKRHELVLQKCNDCGKYQWYPRGLCVHCGSSSLVWSKVSGEGEVYSYTVIRQVIDNSPAFQKDLPFVVALIELAEGPRMISNLKDCKPEDVKIGMRVRVFFEDATDKISLPRFRPA